MKLGAVSACVLAGLVGGMACAADSIYYAVFGGTQRESEWNGVGPGGASKAAEPTKQFTYLLFPFHVDANGALVASKPSDNCIFINEIEGKHEAKLYPMDSNFTVFFTPPDDKKVFTHACMFGSAREGVSFDGSSPEGWGYFYHGYGLPIKSYKSKGDKSELPISKHLSGVYCGNDYVDSGRFDAYFNTEELYYDKKSTIAINETGPFADSLTSWSAALQTFVATSKLKSTVNAYNDRLKGDYLAAGIELAKNGSRDAFAANLSLVSFDGVNGGASTADGVDYPFAYNMVTSDGAFIQTVTNIPSPMVTQGFLAKGKQVLSQAQEITATGTPAVEFAITIAKSKGMGVASVNGKYNAYRMVNDEAAGKIKVKEWVYTFDGAGAGTVTTSKGTHDLTYTVAADGAMTVTFTTADNEVEVDDGVVAKDGGIFALVDGTNKSQGITTGVRESSAMTAANLKGRYRTQTVSCAADGSNAGLMDTTMRFNGDGTGFSKSSYGTSKFTYAVEPNGKFTFTYKSNGGADITRHGAVSSDLSSFLVSDPDEAGGKVALALGTKAIE